VRHVRYLADHMGVEHVALGSDFDGAAVPTALGGIAGLPRLVAALREDGFDEAAVAKITHENWLRVLDATWS
jgi:membrane dipeptidase